MVASALCVIDVLVGHTLLGVQILRVDFLALDDKVGVLLWRSATLGPRLREAELFLGVERLGHVGVVERSEHRAHVLPNLGHVVVHDLLIGDAGDLVLLEHGLDSICYLLLALSAHDSASNLVLYGLAQGLIAGCVGNCLELAELQLDGVVDALLNLGVTRQSRLDGLVNFRLELLHGVLVLVIEHGADKLNDGLSGFLRVLVTCEVILYLLRKNFKKFFFLHNQKKLMVTLFAEELSESRLASFIVFLWFFDFSKSSSVLNLLHSLECNTIGRSRYE